MEIYKLVEQAKSEGYNEANAESKVCQDIILNLISHSNLNRNITIKGGVVMRSLSKNSRRATQDIDFDFIKYPLTDEAILSFIERLNYDEDITVKATGNIEELKQQDYHGRRVHVVITDKNGYSLTSKVDIGVHKHFDIDQEEYCFDIGFDDDGASLLINSKEQMLTEKLRSILKFGAFSTRYKDIYDIYYLSDKVDKAQLIKCFEILIFSDKGMRENNLSDIIRRVKSTFSNKNYISNLSTSRKNWLGVDNNTVINEIIAFLSDLNL